jgi:hypothetical protein
MSVEHLGEPLTGVYPIPGGQARLYERGLTVNGAAESMQSSGVLTPRRTLLDPYGLKPVCQDRNACSSVSLSTATRTVRNGWTVSRFHRICCRLIIRFAMI